MACAIHTECGHSTGVGERFESINITSFWYRKDVAHFPILVACRDRRGFITATTPRALRPRHLMARSSLFGDEVLERRASLKGDQEKHPAPAGPSAPGAVASCKMGHPLRTFTTPFEGFSCSHCNTEFGPKVSLGGCRKCDYDLCFDCIGNLFPDRSRNQSGLETPGTQTPVQRLGSASAAGSFSYESHESPATSNPMSPRREEISAPPLRPQAASEFRGMVQKLRSEEHAPDVNAGAARIKARRRGYRSASANDVVTGTSLEREVREKFGSFFGSVLKLFQLRGITSSDDLREQETRPLLEAARAAGFKTIQLNKLREWINVKQGKGTLPLTLAELKAQQKAQDLAQKQAYFAYEREKSILRNAHRDEVAKKEKQLKHEQMVRDAEMRRDRTADKARAQKDFEKADIEDTLRRSEFLREKKAREKDEKKLKHAQEVRAAEMIKERKFHDELYQKKHQQADIEATLRRSEFLKEKKAREKDAKKLKHDLDVRAAEMMRERHVDDQLALKKIEQADIEATLRRSEFLKEKEARAKDATKLKHDLDVRAAEMMREQTAEAAADEKAREKEAIRHYKEVSDGYRERKEEGDEVSKAIKSEHDRSVAMNGALARAERERLESLIG